jgi:hypothetical protein
MSYESDMLERFAMPTQKAVEQTLLRALLKHGGIIKEFASGEEIVDELANEFQLNEQQRSAALETVYRKENRLKKSLLWHRLLFRSADSLARQNLVSRPTQTLRLTKKREWMLTEKGFDEVLELCNIPVSRKEILPTRSFEVQKIVRKLIEAPKVENYNPVDRQKPVTKTTREAVLRRRGFRQAVVEAYECKCAICGLKIQSPDAPSWEVEAAHIVPNRSFGRDDVCNGLALCHLHHWAFDVGWFTLSDNYAVQVSSKVRDLPSDFGKIYDYEFFRMVAGKNASIHLPNIDAICPHQNAIRWHRQNIFHH